MTHWVVGFAGIYWHSAPPARYKRVVMRTLRFVPLAFIAGVHGFPMFVSYLAVVVTVLHVVRFFRQ